MVFDTSAAKLRLAELFLFTLRDGTILRFTTFAQDVLFGGNTYVSAPITRTTHSQDSDLSTSEIKVTVPRVSPWLDPDKLLSRYLDGAELQITWVDLTNLASNRIAFLGYTGEITYTHLTVEITFKTIADFFNKKVPKRKYVESCGHTMYDSGCKLVRATYAVNGTVGGGSTTQTIYDAGLVQADGYFNLGIIEFTSGVCTGEKRWVKAFVTGEVSLFDALPSAPSASDTFSIVPHCRKAYASCRDDYGNEVNFGGFQDIPDPNEIY